VLFVNLRSITGIYQSTLLTKRVHYTAIAAYARIETLNACISGLYLENTL
jgi:metal-dependent HD superfamily phosphatase/phosphodiesterase